MKYSLRGSNLYLNLVSGVVYDLPAPMNLSYMWNFGSLLGFFLGVQIVTGLFLVAHYTPDVDLAFYSVCHIIRDVNYGWVVRSLHANGASFYFACMYFHVGRGLYYQAYCGKNTWLSGSTLLILSMAAAFLGYVLPWGQMSFWAATVITNLFSAIPYVGPALVDWIWGGFSVGNATLKRFFMLHYLIPFIILCVVTLHVVFLHETGSSNPVGVDSDSDKVPFHSYYTWKDVFGIFSVVLVLLLVCFLDPDLFYDPVNYVPADPLTTPLHIQPEWYFLFAYTILRSVPNKLGGVIALFASVLILYILPFMPKGWFRGLGFYPVSRFFFWVFVADFSILTWIGSCPVESPYLEIGIFASVLYFIYFLVSPYLDKFWSDMMMTDLK